MKLLADENMPYVHELFDDWAEVTTCPGRTMTPQQVAEAEVLLVRSITRVDEALMARASGLDFVGTATIGCDHIDTDYLTERNIAFASAPGCNKVAVGDYVLAALLKVADHKGWQLADKRLAVVGAGNTGGEVAQRARALGMEVLLCDPPRAAREGGNFVSLAQALTADIVSFHVPLTHDGAHPTWHLLDQDKIRQLDPEQVLINACRGDVWDNRALLARQQSPAPLTLVMDVWEHEPALLTELVPHTLVATPHIAGYSLEGKARGTFALYQALCRLRGRAVQGGIERLLPVPEITRLSLGQVPDQALLGRLVRLVYDIDADDRRFRAALGQPDFFDHLRKTYPERRELGSLMVSCQDPATAGQLAGLGFITDVRM